MQIDAIKFVVAYFYLNILSLIRNGSWHKKFLRNDTLNPIRVYRYYQFNYSKQAYS